jgi:transcriptional regulator with XRE-family HTH domain
MSAKRTTHPLVVRLRDERRRQRLLQEDVARRIGCERSVVGRWENRGNMKFLNFVDWAEALGMDVVLVKRETRQ